MQLLEYYDQRAHLCGKWEKSSKVFLIEPIIISPHLFDYYFYLILKYNDISFMIYIYEHILRT